MKGKALIYGLLIIALAGLSSCMLHSSYKSALKEAKNRNAAPEETGSAPLIDLTGPPPDWTEEVLLGLFANRNDLAVRVSNGGCTEKEGFRVNNPAGPRDLQRRCGSTRVSVSALPRDVRFR
ncbi:MAG: hypothetical protein L3J03_08850 [Desulfobacterales bacterium]|nr:hypothetical protein [Desulfobacterales bacterium]